MAAHPGNIELVLVDGQVMVENGKIPQQTLDTIRELTVRSASALHDGGR